MAVVVFLFLFAVRLAYGQETATLDGQPVDPAKYRALQEDGQLPLVAEMTDVELAQRLNLDLPQNDPS